MQDTDVNYYEVPASNGTYSDLVVDPRETGRDPSRYDDLIKLSNIKGTTIRNFRAVSGGLHKEDAIDLNRFSSGNVIEDGIIEAGQNGVAVTIKGGSSYNTLSRLSIARPGNHCDIEIGNHSDQSWDLCVGTVIKDCTRTDGRPVLVAWGRGTKPTLIGNARINWWWTTVLHVYVYAKHYLPFIP